MIVANMATYPPRQDSMLAAVRSVAAQVDVLNLVLNEYREVPAELRAVPNVNPILPKEDTKDTGKYLPQAGAAANMIVPAQLTRHCREGEAWL